MKVDIIISLYILFFQQQFFVKIQAIDTCPYYAANRSVLTMSCPDDCCSLLASSFQAACCSHISLSTLAIPFFVVAGICILGICVVYCRPLWKMCLCGYRCPCGNRSRVNSPTSAPTHENPIFVLNNDDLPDYETTTKNTTIKDITPPPYTFVTTHPNEFGIESPIPSAPPQYYSRRSSVATTINGTPTN